MLQNSNQMITLDFRQQLTEQMFDTCITTAIYSCGHGENNKTVAFYRKEKGLEAKAVISELV